MDNIFERRIWSIDDVFNIQSFDRYLIVTFRCCELTDDGDLYSHILNSRSYLEEFEGIDRTLTPAQRFGTYSFMQDPSTSVDILSLYVRMGGSGNYEPSIKDLMESVSGIIEDHVRVFIEFDYDLEYDWLDILDKKFNLIVN